MEPKWEKYHETILRSFAAFTQLFGEKYKQRKNSLLSTQVLVHGVYLQARRFSKCSTENIHIKLSKSQQWQWNAQAMKQCCNEQRNEKGRI